MTIIYDRPEEKIINLLYSDKKDCLYPFCFHVQTPSLNQKDFDSLPSFITKMVGDPESMIFVCDNKEIFVFSYHLSMSMFVKFRERITSHIGFMVANNIEVASFFDLDVSRQSLIDIVNMRIKNKISGQKNKSLEEEKNKEICKKNIMDGLSKDSIKTLKDRRRKHGKAQILVIEDDPFSRRLIEASLGENFSIKLSEDARSGLENYLNIAPNILFLDINLPDVNGHDVLDKILEIDEECFVVMLSGNSQYENVVKAVSKGAKGFVSKPFSKEKLIHYIHKSHSFSQGLSGGKI